MKQSVDDFAIFGGVPSFRTELHVGRPNIGDKRRIMERISDLLERRWLTNDGPYVEEFERRLADFLGVKHCIAMCNATVALEIAIRGLGLKGEVIVPSFTFVATAHALQWQEITPIFCDIDPKTNTLDPCQVERMITPRTTGIIGVHIWGISCDVDGLADVARRHNLKLLYDSAHALGCSYKGKMIGAFGNAEIFSFHATKFLNSFEGGAVATNDDELATKVSLMKNFGFADDDTVIYIGTNGKMNEAAAAMGLTSLESLDDFISVNYDNYKQYQKQLADIPGVEVLTYNEKERNNFQYIVLEINEAIAGITRDELHQILVAENILARRYFFPGCHKMEPYRSYFPHSGLLLPHTESLVRRVLCLPTGTAIQGEDINKICQIISMSVAESCEIKARLCKADPHPSARGAAVGSEVAV
jgi:dTDP-4-amino-4,6-dideoxygalactose transaminase